MTTGLQPPPSATTSGHKAPPSNHCLARWLVGVRHRLTSAAALGGRRPTACASRCEPTLVNPHPCQTAALLRAAVMRRESEQIKPRRRGQGDQDRGAKDARGDAPVPREGEHAADGGGYHSGRERSVAQRT